MLAGTSLLRMHMSKIAGYQANARQQLPKWGNFAAIHPERLPSVTISRAISPG